MNRRSLLLSLAVAAFAACTTDGARDPLSPSGSPRFGTGGNPHFIKAGAAINADGSMTVSFKATGLADNQLSHFLLTAQATATWVCVNRGGANPTAQNKSTVSGPVSASGDYSSGKNGQVSASLTLYPPPSDIACPPGQSLELASVSYTTIVLADLTNGESITVPDQISACRLPDVRGACDV